MNGAIHPGPTHMNDMQGWESVGEDGYVWQASVPSRVQAEVKQLFVNGERRIPCRSPNIDLHAREGPTTVYHRIRAPLPPPNERRGFYFSHETVSAEVMTASGTVVIVVQGGMVTQHTVTTTGQDDYGTFVILEQEVPVPIGYAADARFAVEGPVDLCDAPGEFFVDVQKRKIRYIPRAGEKITDVDVVLPRLSCLVDMQGAAHVHFFNLALQHTTTDEGRDGAVMIHGAHNVTLHGLALCHMGGFGVVISSDSHHVSMRHTAVWDAGGGAVYVGPALQVSMKRRIPRDIRITDCFLWDLGHVFPGIPGILLYAGERVLIAHNEVAFTGSSAISFGGIPGGPFPDRMAPDTRVEGNNLHHIGMGVLNELGGVHCRGSASESIVMHNVIRDVRPYSYGGWGLYADTGSSNTSWRSNFVFHSSCAGFHLVCGNNVKVHNNLLAYTGEWDGCVRHSPSPHCPSSMEFSQNIIWVNGSTPAVSLIPFVPTALLTVCFDWNVYAHVSATEPLVFPGGLNWNEWRRDKNQDDHSIMGDPGLGMSDLDFSPQPLSAASDVGFEAILLSSVGPRHVSPENSPPFL